MKRILITLTIVISLALTASFLLRSSVRNPLPSFGTINVLEDRRSLINLPMYLALEKGYFNDYHVNIQLTTAKTGEVPMGILEEGKDYQLLLCGGEEMIYALQAENQQYKYIYNLAQSSGSYIFTRNYAPDFKPKFLDRKLIIGAPRGTLKEMILEYYLHSNQLSPQRDVNIAQTLISPDDINVFLSNSGDYLLTEEPLATKLSNKGLGAVQVNFSDTNLPLLNKGLITTPVVLKKNPRLLKDLSKALYQAQLMIYNQPISDYLPLIKKYFPNNTNADLTQAIANYKKSRIWPTNPTPSPQQFENLIKLMSSAGELRTPLKAKDFLETFIIRNTLEEIKKEE